MEIPKDIRELREAAAHFRQRAADLEQQAFEKMEELLEEMARENNDKLLNRTQAIELLWFDSHQSLKNWENKVADLGYLRFQENKILRSEVLRFRDDNYNGTLHKKLRETDRR